MAQVKTMNSELPILYQFLFKKHYELKTAFLMGHQLVVIIILPSWSLNSFSSSWFCFDLEWTVDIDEQANSIKLLSFMVESLSAKQSYKKL